MSLAARVKARKAAGEPFDFAARRTALIEAEARGAAAEAAPSATVVDAATVGRGGSTAPRNPSPAQRKSLKAAALQVAANENVQDGSADLTPYDQQLVKLYADKARLKQIESTEGKVALKRELLPEYSGWVLGRLEAASEPGARPGQDDVLAHVLMWAIDVGDYTLGLELARYFHQHGHVLPQQVKRNLAAFVTEEVAEAALKAFRAGPDQAKAFPAAILGDVDELFAEADMPDQVRAKLKKAVGQALLTALEGLDDQPSANARAGRQAALDYFRRARELDQASGCVKLIEQLEREIKKLDEAPADS